MEKKERCERRGGERRGKKLASHCSESLTLSPGESQVDADDDEKRTLFSSSSSLVLLLKTFSSYLQHSKKKHTAQQQHNDGGRGSPLDDDR